MNYTVLLHKKFETLTLDGIFSYILCFTLHYLMLYHFEIHSAFDGLRMALLCLRLAASHLCVAAHWQLHLNNEPGLQVKAASFGDRIGIN